MVGGALSYATGGKFGHGFVSAAIRYEGNNIAVGAIIRGTVSAATGGKFANGAITGAFAVASRNRSAPKDTSQGSFKISTAKATTGTRLEKGIKNKVMKSLEELRKTEKFSQLESGKKRKFKLIFDLTKETEYDPATHTININPYIYDKEYATILPSDYDEQFRDSSGELDFDAIDNFVENYPKWNRFSIERVLFHEAAHSLQGDSGIKYQMSPDSYENPTIERTNQFMRKYYNEPFRKNHF